MKLAVIGSGYVGLVSGVCFAEIGHHVTCVDNNPGKIAQLRQGRIPIYEPGLAELIAANRQAGRLHFTTDLAAAVHDADAVFIAVGTPPKEGDGSADLRHVHAVANELAHALEGFTVIVTKSTVPVGTGDAIEATIRQLRADLQPGADFAVASNPEFLKEGAAIADFMAPDRIVIGTDDTRAIAILRDLYRPITARGHELVVMDRRGAELTKYAANAMLATRITFINEIADLCERVGTNVETVAHGVGLDRRIGPHFLKAGPGYGGSCFPKDTLALIHTGESFGARQSVVEAVAGANAARKHRLGERIRTAMGGDAGGKRVALLGLAFKANTDDLRDSPAVTIARMLQADGADVRISDPQGLEHAQDAVPGCTTIADPYAAVDDADAVIIATEWPQFGALDLARIRQLMRGKLFIDLRNLIAPDALDAAGFDHLGIGRPPAIRRGSGLPRSHSLAVAEVANG